MTKQQQIINYLKSETDIDKLLDISNDYSITIGDKQNIIVYIDYFNDYFKPDGHGKLESLGFLRIEDHIDMELIADYCVKKHDSLGSTEIWQILYS